MMRLQCHQIGWGGFEACIGAGVVEIGGTALLAHFAISEMFRWMGRDEFAVQLQRVINDSSLESNKQLIDVPVPLG